jgi:predicted exporter
MAAKKKGVQSSQRFLPAVRVDRQRRILRELPERMERRVADIYARNEMLRATEAQNLRIERDRVNAHLHGMPEGLQRVAAQHHVGDLTRRIHKLAQAGVPR